MAKPALRFLIYADGACSGNPGPGGWAAVILRAQPGADEAWRVEELGGRAEATTNNRMELTAVGKALRRIEEEPGEAVVLTDSSYVIRGVTEWARSWRKNGWKKSDGEAVANERYWKRLLELLDARAQAGSGAVEFRYVPGHSGVPGNERCDGIAVAFSRGEESALFTGSYADYVTRTGVRLVGDDGEAFGRERPASAGKKAAIYLSLVDGRAERHASWAECERRVTGRSGAKYRKCRDEAEAERTLKEWGLRGAG